MHDCLAVCPPGLEPLLADELRSLSLRPAKEIHGGVPFRATDRELYLANAWTRLATRIVVRAGTFVARSFADLERRAADLPWPAFLAAGITPVFRVTSTGSTLYHTDAIAERLHRVTGIEPLPAGSPEATDPERVQLVVVRVARSEMGQGTLTGLVQLVAEELEADWSKVKWEYVTPGQNLARKRA